MNNGAAEFFSESDAASLEQHIQRSEASFEETCVRRLLKIAGRDHRELASFVREQYPEGTGVKFAHAEELYGSLPVRLVTERFVALKSQKAATERRIRDKAFHELTVQELFSPGLMLKTRMFKNWLECKTNDGIVDERSLGLVFACVGTPYVIHDWKDGADVYDGLVLTFTGSVLDDCGRPRAESRRPSRMPPVWIQKFDTMLPRLARPWDAR